MAMLAIPAAAELLAQVGGTAAISKLANTLMTKGAKKMARDTIGKVGSLVTTKEGREKLLKGAGKIGGGVAKVAGVGAKLLGATHLISQRKAEKAQKFIEKGHMGFQHALGKISKVGKHFGFL